jgi:hypothetical protein
MDVVAQIAPEVDRMVFSIGPAISKPDRARLRTVMDDIGLESMGYLANFSEFFGGDGITTELAQTRMRYVPPTEIESWLGTLADSGLVTSTADGWVATDRFPPLLEALADVQLNAARLLWHDNEDIVGTVNDAASRVIAAATPDHLVAAVHRQLDLPDDPYARMFRQMVTLRYIRQHDHAEAWTDAGLSADRMVVLTELWHGGTVDDSTALTALVDDGLASLPPGLTERGQQVRDAIEDETNRRNAEDFVILGDTGATAFLEALRSLPPQ